MYPVIYVLDRADYRPIRLIKNPYIAYNEPMYDFCSENVDIAKSIMYNIGIVKISLFT